MPGIDGWVRTTKRLLENYDFGSLKELGGPEGRGICKVYYDEDEDGERYATVGLTLPEGVWAEIEDGTYGQLQGIRFYLWDN